jgi:hypothetical protein
VGIAHYVYYGYATQAIKNQILVLYILMFLLQYGVS